MTKLHEDNFTPRVNFARVKILHGGSETENKKKKIKTIIKRTRKMNI